MCSHCLASSSSHPITLHCTACPLHTLQLVTGSDGIYFQRMFSPFLSFPLSFSYSIFSLHPVLLVLLYSAQILAPTNLYYSLQY